MSCPLLLVCVLYPKAFWPKRVRHLCHLCHAGFDFLEGHKAYLLSERRLVTLSHPGACASSPYELHHHVQTRFLQLSAVSLHPKARLKECLRLQSRVLQSTRHVVVPNGSFWF